MVKNTTGGKGSKFLARKNENTTSSALRQSQDPLEVYAIVVKALGNCMFHVNTMTGTKGLLMRARGKFTGKNKKNNFISVGCFVLVGLREFTSNKENECDLLEVYSDHEVKRLLTVPSLNSRFFLQTTESLHSDSIMTNADDIIFTNIEEEGDFSQTTTTTTTKNIIQVNNEIINIDDI
jgi:translation initiation factor IF-1